jgi:hypothetical protein
MRYVDLRCGSQTSSDARGHAKAKLGVPYSDGRRHGYCVKDVANSSIAGQSQGVATRLTCIITVTHTWFADRVLTSCLSSIKIHI